MEDKYHHTSTNQLKETHSRSDPPSFHDTQKEVSHVKSQSPLKFHHSKDSPPSIKKSGPHSHPLSVYLGQQDSAKKYANVVSEASEPRILQVNQASHPAQSYQPLRSRGNPQRRPTVSVSPQRNRSSMRSENSQQASRKNKSEERNKIPALPRSYGTQQEFLSPANEPSPVKMAREDTLRPKEYPQTHFSPSEKNPVNLNFGSTEKFGHLHRFPQSHEKRDQYANHRTDYRDLRGSEVGMSSQKMTADYQFLGGVGDIETDTDNTGQLRSEAKQNSLNKLGSIGKFLSNQKRYPYGANLDSMQKIQEGQRLSYQNIIDAEASLAPNPFNYQMRNHQSSAQSSQEAPLSFGGGFGPHRLEQHSDQNKDLEQQLGSYSNLEQPQIIDQRMRIEDQRGHNNRHSDHQSQQSQPEGDCGLTGRALALMGEKACMRMTMKELLVLMDHLSDKMYRQSLHQEVVTANDHPQNQINRLVELSIKDADLKNASIDSQHFEQRREELFFQTRKMSNLDILEKIRMDSQIMQVRFTEFFKNENSIYSELARQRDQTRVLQEQLYHLEQALSQERASAQKNSKFSEGKPGQNFTLEQLSPVNTFKHKPAATQIDLRNQVLANSGLKQHFQSVNQQNESIPFIQEMSIIESNNQFQISQDIYKKLEEKDNQLQRLNEFVENLKKDISLQRDSHRSKNTARGRPHSLDAHAINDRAQDFSPTSEDPLRERDHKVMDLHSQIFDLKQRNSFLEEQLQSLFNRMHHQHSPPRQLYSQQPPLASVGDINSPERASAANPQMSYFQTNMAPSFQQYHQSIEAGHQMIAQSESATKHVFTSYGVSPYIVSNSVKQQPPEIASPTVKGFNPGQLYSLQHPHADKERSKTMSAQDPVAIANRANVRSEGDPRHTINQSSLTKTQGESQKIFEVQPEKVSFYHTLEDSKAQSIQHEVQSQLESIMEADNQAEKLYRIKGLAEQLQQKLSEQMQQNEHVKIAEFEAKQRLNQQEAEFRHILEERTYEFNQLRSVTVDLQQQASVHSQTLEKAQMVIRKLTEDLDLAKRDAVKAIEEAEQLRRDNARVRQQVFDSETDAEKREAEYRHEIKKIDEDLNGEVKEVKQALLAYQRQTDDEKKEIEAEAEDWRAEVRKKNIIIDNLEKKHQHDKENLNQLVKAKIEETLHFQDQAVSLKIKMEAMQSQLDQDIVVRNELQEKQITFMKNKINDLNQQLNRLSLREDNSHSSTSSGEGNPGSGEKKRSGSPSLKTHHGYLKTLEKEFLEQAKEQVRIRDIITEKSAQTQASMLSKHLEGFETFKVKVLDSLVDWFSKSSELTKTANRYYDSLEAYKLMFVQMKQLVKQKDDMLRAVSGHAQSVVTKNRRDHHEMTEVVKESNKNTFINLKKMTRLLEIKLRIKEREVEDLIRFQEEFRRQFQDLGRQKEELEQSCYSLNQRLTEVEGKLQEKKQEHYQYQESLRTCLEIEEGPNAFRIIPEYVRSVKGLNTDYKMEINDLNTHNSQLRRDLDDTTTRLTGILDEQERLAKSEQRRLEEEVEDQARMFIAKEAELLSELERVKEELEETARDCEEKERQIQRLEEDVVGEYARQQDLQSHIDQLNIDIKSLLEGKRMIESSYDDQEKRLHDFQEIIGQRNSTIDNLGSQVKDRDSKLQEWEQNLQTKQQTLDEVQARLDDACQKLKAERETLQGVEKDLDKVLEENAFLNEQIKTLKAKEKGFIEKSEIDLQLVDEIRTKLQQKDQVVFEQKAELERYQDSLTYMSRQADQVFTLEQEISRMDKEKKELRNKVQEKELEVDQLQRKLNPRKVTSGVQTQIESFREMEGMGAQINYLTGVIQELEHQNEQLQEVVKRNIGDIDRVIEEKRQLEHEIDVKNSTIYNTSHAASKSHDLSENVNISNYQRMKRSASPSDDSTLKQVLAEKSSYITKLENELNDLRRENERLKDQVIQFEMENFGQKTKMSNNFMRTNALSGTNPLGDYRTLADSRSIHQTMKISPGMTQQLSKPKFGYETGPQGFSTLTYNNYISQHQPSPERISSPPVRGEKYQEDFYTLQNSGHQGSQPQTEPMSDQYLQENLASLNFRDLTYQPSRYGHRNAQSNQYTLGQEGSAEGMFVDTREGMSSQSKGQYEGGEHHIGAGEGDALAEA